MNETIWWDIHTQKHMTILVQYSCSNTLFSHRWYGNSVIKTLFWKMYFQNKSSFLHFHVIPNLSDIISQMEIFWEMSWWTKLLFGCHSILQNTVFYVPLKKDSHTGLGWYENDDSLHFWVPNNSFYHYPCNYSIKVCGFGRLGNIEEQMLKDCQTGIYYSYLA